MSTILKSAPSPTQHEVLQNFLKSLLDPKDHAVSPEVSPDAGAIAAASGEKPATGLRTSSRTVVGDC